MEYQQTQYEKDCLEAAKSDKGFDATNAREIGDLHGVEPKEVLKEIRAIRSFRKVFEK